jgi:hypothetical protein
MFYLSINAGLGNKMFQYASIKGLAKKMNIDMKVYSIDTSQSHQEHHDNYHWFYNKIAHDIELHDPIDFNHNETVFYNQPNNENIGKPTNFEDFKNIKNIVVSGYFQYEPNFLFIRPELLEIFKENEYITRELDLYAASLGLTYDNITALHIRLGDYMYMGEHFVNLENHYTKCIHTLRELQGNLHIVIICEDPHNIQHVYPNLLSFLANHDNVYFRHTDIDKQHSVEFDMYLLSRCKNVICSNSTFAWWGAWLNQRPDKTVFIPNPWMNIRTDNMLQMENACLVDNSTPYNHENI